MSKVIVAGSINMDLVARAERHPLPGETVPGHSAATYPGGKGANQAVASARLGADTVMIGRLGTDVFGPQLKQFLEDQGVRLDYVRETSQAPTGVALIVVAESGENTIVVVPGANGLVSVADVDAVPIEKGDVVLSQFEIPTETIEALFRRCRRLGATTLLNAAPAKRCSRAFLELADIILVNETELGFMIGESVDASSSDSVATAARALRARPDQVIVATLGADGALAVSGEQQTAVPGHKVKAVDTTAAGDTFAGALAARLAAGVAVESALVYANAAAAICVQRPGAGPSIPFATEVDDMVLHAEPR